MSDIPKHLPFHVDVAQSHITVNKEAWRASSSGSGYEHVSIVRLATRCSPSGSSLSKAGAQLPAVSSESREASAEAF